MHETRLIFFVSLDIRCRGSLTLLKGDAINLKSKQKRSHNQDQSKPHKKGFASRKYKT